MCNYRKVFIMNQRILPAYPLFVLDPNFSIWSNTDNLNGGDTVFWDDGSKKTYGLVRANGKTYSFLGLVKDTIKLKQESVSIGAFNTTYTFSCDDFDLTVNFISALVPNNNELSARPTCYFTYKIFPRKKLQNVAVLLALHQEYAYNKKTEDSIVGGGFSRKKYEISFFGLNRQLIMSNAFDRTAPDWGYTYITGKRTLFTSQSTLDEFIAKGQAEYIFDNTDKYLLAIDENEELNTPYDGMFLVAFDDLCSIYYYGEWLKGYYFRNGKTIFDAIEETYTNLEVDFQTMNDFSLDLEKRLEKYDESYKLICYAALRQTMGGHKLVENKDKELIFLSKECGSNGCIATVDITYPSMPLFLLYNPELVSAMVRPIFKFAKMDVWKYDFAPHDAGVYPYVIGQIYAAKGNHEKNTKYVSNMFRRNRANGIIVTHPHVYQFPANCEIYEFKNQMPYEECGNMLIVSYAAIKSGADVGVYKENYHLLKKWYEYLEKCGLVPFEQLSTDDFASRLNKNVNLSIKSMVAVKSFALIAKLFGDFDSSEQAEKCLAKYQQEFTSYFSQMKNTPITYDHGEDTYMLKYNLTYDRIFHLGIFEESFYEKELVRYLKEVTRYGVNLDSRSDLLKTDWLVYVATFTKDKEEQRKLYGGIATFLKETPDRVPFSDLYHTETAKIKDFQNRTVQGGVFVLLLQDELNQTL